MVAKFISAYIQAKYDPPDMQIAMEVKGKLVTLDNIPLPGELTKEFIKVFNQHLSIKEDI